MHSFVQSQNGAHHFLELVHGGRLQLGQSGGQLVGLGLLLWWNDPAGRFTNSAKAGQQVHCSANQLQKTAEEAKDLQVSVTYFSSSILFSASEML